MGSGDEFGEARAGFGDQGFDRKSRLGESVEGMEDPAVPSCPVGLAAEPTDGDDQAVSKAGEGDGAFSTEALVVERTFTGDDVIGRLDPVFQIQQSCQQIETGNQLILPEYAGAAAGLPGLVALRFRVPSSLSGNAIVNVTALVNGVKTNSAALPTAAAYSTNVEQNEP